ncbi:putative lysophospholipase BODYGUARD 3 [Ranunculus cassubicifolius]
MYVDVVSNHVSNQLNCKVTIIHGANDELLPVECSYNLQSRIPRASLKVIEKKDHIMQACTHHLHFSYLLSF